MRVAAAVDPNSGQRGELQKLVRRRTTAVRVVERCRIVLLAGEGMQDVEIARELEVAPRMAARCECTGSFVTLWTEDLHYNPLEV